jgi:multimeric flavodoxin WrbA
MSDTKLSNEAKEVMENVLSIFPSVIRESYKTKIMKGVEYLLLKKGLTEVTKDVFLEALEETLLKSFEPVILRFKDPQKISDMVASQKEVDEKNPLVKVRRWKLPVVKSDTPLKNIFALMAGPRKQGNTDCIMDTLLEGAREAGCHVEKLYISDLTISPCVGCMACEAKELETYCAIKDDMTDLYGKFLKCDAFVMGFPVYTARECSQAATFFDRLKALSSKGHYQKLARPRKGALVVTWGWPTEDSYNHVVENAVFVLKLFGVDTAEIVTGCGFWEAYYKKGTARLDKKGLEHAKEAGRALVSG